MDKSKIIVIKNFFILNYVFFSIITKFLLIIPLINSLYFNLLNNQKIFYKNLRNCFKFFAFFFIYCYISNLINTIELKYHYKFFSLILFLFSSVSIATYFSKNKYIFTQTLRMIFYLNIFIIIDIFIFKISNFSIISSYANNSNQGVRYGSLFFDERIVGFFLLNSIPIVILYLNKYCHQCDLYFKKNYLLIILLFVITIYLTGERRNFLLSILVFSYILFLYLNNFLNKKKIIIIFLLSSIFFTGFLFTSIKNQNPSSLNYRMVNLIIKTVKSVPMVIEDRKEAEKYMLNNNIGNWVLLYIDGTSVFLQNSKNILIGVGHKKYYKSCNELNLVCSNHPHNMYLELLINYGLFGLIFFCIIIYKTLKILITKNHKIYHEALIFIICFVFPFLPSGSILSSNLAFNLLIFGSLFLADYYFENLKTEKF